MLDWDAKGVYRLAALQSTAGRSLLKRCGRSPDDISSIVLVEKDRHFVRSEAILRCVHAAWLCARANVGLKWPWGKGGGSNGRVGGGGDYE